MNEARKKTVIALLAAAAITGVSAQTTIDYQAEAIVNAGNGDFAPYYIMSNRHGVLTQNLNGLINAGVSKKMITDDRFSFGFGAQLYAGYSHAAPYTRCNENGSITTTEQSPASFWIQQLYGEVKYRSLFLSIGAKEHTSALLSPTLSSGDLVESGNSRPIPEVRVGFIDFQDIPFTNGWVQIQGEISYGKFMDKNWNKNHYNYASNHLNIGALYTYKRAYFRTNPRKQFSATVGMQVGGMFGGTTTWYNNGKEIRSAKYSRSLKEFFKMLIPKDGGVAYYSGSSLGCWDLNLRYRLKNGYTVEAYMQKPFEDGSGIGFLNGFDGLWGLRFSTGLKRGVITNAVVEYIDFTNQSGPMHWDPDDNPGSTITDRAEGMDDYYNNHEYNSYANYGMAIGTPFLPSPIYNQNGFLGFLHNRIRGFHIGIEGYLDRWISYRVLGGYRKSLGSGRRPITEPLHDTSMMAELSFAPPRVKHLKVKVQVAFDHGTLFGNTVGGALSIAYTGSFNIMRH